MKHAIKQYKHYGECLHISNGTLDIAFALTFGLRVIRFSLYNGENMFYEQPEDADYLCTAEGWRIYGGHRLWFAPESAKTYYPDHAPIRYVLLEDGARVTQDVDPYLHIEKAIELHFCEDPNEARVQHIITNRADEAVTGAPWAVSVARPGGVMRVPFTGEAGKYSPERMLSLWGDTNMADERLSFSRDAAIFTHTPSDAYMKVGLLCKEGLVEYAQGGNVFLKRFAYERDEAYPDGGVNFETYLCRHMIEIESLAPLTTLAPNQSAVHEERWILR